MSTSHELPLAQALMQLGLSWGQGYRAVLTGALTGRQLPNGRWVVTVSSVDEYRARLGSFAPQISGSQ